MALADNVDGGDDLDLIVTTMNGNVFCFSTPSPHHPLKVKWGPKLIGDSFLLSYFYLFLYFFILIDWVIIARLGDHIIKVEITLQTGTIVRVYISLLRLELSVTRKERTSG